MNTLKITLSLSILTVLLGACSFSYSPLSVPPSADNPPPVTLRRLSTTGEFSAEAYQQGEVDSMSPIYIVLRNETSSPKILSLNSLIAVSSDGRKVPPFPAEEAARQAGEAGAVPGMWKGAATGAGVGTVIGTVAGALIGLVIGRPLSGAIVGGAATGGAGALVGAEYGLKAGSLNAQAQVLNLHLRDQVLHPGSQTNGYVFFPKGVYSRLGAVLLSDEERQQELLVQVMQAPAVESESGQESERQPKTSD